MNQYFVGWMRIAATLWLGILIFVGTSYVAALFSLRWLALPIAVFLISIAGFDVCKNWNRLKIGWSGPHWFLVPFATLFSLSVTTSGWMTKDGMVVRGVNAVDGIWNIALAEELIHAFPPQHPGLAGVPLRGYHILYNLLIADASRISGISTVRLHFHLVPIILSFLLVYGIYAFSWRLTGSSRHALWSTVFGLAGGSFSFVLPLFFGRSVSVDDALGVTQPFSLLVSPSFVLSLLSILYTWIFLDEYALRPSPVWIAMIGLGAGLSAGMKVYAGMILLPTIVLYAFVRRNIEVLISTLLSAAAVFLPLNAAYGFLRYQPLWPPHRVMQSTLDFTQWELKRQSLEGMGAVWGLWKLEAIAFGIFVFGNLGTRAVGLAGLYFLKKREVGLLFWMLVVASLVSFTLPMLFLQPIGAFNMIQFFWYFLVFMGILAGWGWSLMVGKISNAWAIVLSVALLVFTLPSSTEKIVTFMGKPTYFIAKEEMAFYRELRRVGERGDTVLVVPLVDRYTREDLRDWFYRTGPAIPAFTGKRVFLGNEVVQFPYDEWIEPRVALLNAFLLGGTDALRALQTLQEKYSIDFIVVPKGVQPWFVGKPWLHVLFANEYATIYRVQGLPQ